jgi:hypothetical protein
MSRFGKNILWLSRHRPIPSQIKELQRLYGEDCHVQVDTEPFVDADEVMSRYYRFRNGFDELVLVAPLSVCQEILKRGIQPLWAVMKLVDCNSPEVEISTDGRKEKLGGRVRCYKFVKFRRLVSIRLEFQDLN